MPTIFSKGNLGSGTDMNTLLKEGNDANHFCSLIVNNKGEYAAAITRQLTAHSIVKSSISYSTFDNAQVSDESNERVEDVKYIEYTMLDITIEKPDTSITKLLSRINEVAQKKRLRFNISQACKQSIASPRTQSQTPAYPELDLFGTSHKEMESLHKELTARENPDPYNKMLKDTLKEEKQEEKPAFSGAYNAFDELDSLDFYSNIKLEERTINCAVACLLTCDMMAPLKSHLDLTQWAKNIDKVAAKRFVDLADFQFFADYLIEALINDIVNDSNYEEYVSVYGDDSVNAVWADSIIKKLEEYPSGKCIEYYKKALQVWML